MKKKNNYQVQICCPLVIHFSVHLKIMSDREIIEFSLMGERERNKIEVEFKKLADTIRD